MNLGNSSLKNVVVAWGVAAGLALSAPGQSRADVIVSDLTAWDPNNDIGSWRQPNTSAYGQVLSAPAGTDELDSVTFELALTSDSIQYQNVLFAWDQATQSATGPALFTSSVMTLSAASGDQAITTILDTPVTAGGQYVDVMEALSGSGAAIYGLVGEDGYTGLSFDNVGTDFSQLTSSPWSLANANYEAFAYSADFSEQTTNQVPESSSLNDFVAAFLALGLVAGSRKNNKTIRTTLAKIRGSSPSPTA